MDKELKEMFSLILQKLDGVDRRFESMEARLDGMDRRFDAVEARLDGMDRRFDAVEARLDAMDTRLDALDTGLRNVRLKLENEIAENIKRVAEGHMDLSRNLHEAMKPQTEIEMLVIRVNSLETKVRDLQQKVSTIS